MSSFHSFAQGDFEYDGIWYNYILGEEGTVEVAGDPYNNNCSGDIVIPEIVSYGYRVTGIGRDAFRYCRNITSVTLPASISYIGDGAFWCCENISSVKIPEGVTRIGESAFNNCHHLDSIIIPASVNRIGLRAFVSCMLTSITVDENNAVYDSRDNCNAIIETETGNLILGCQNTVIPSDIKCIGNDAFGGSGITGPIVIPEGVTSIGEYAFRVCRGITSISIPESVKTIGQGAFSYCTDIESIVIPSGIDSIRNGTFNCCFGLKNVSLPSSLICIDEYAFYGCESLATINLPESIKTIGKSAFIECINLSSITIPNSVTSIGQGAFDGCLSLTSITIPGSMKSVDMAAFSNCGLESILFAEGVQSIVGRLDNYEPSKIASVTVPSSVTHIDDEAFQWCYSVDSVNWNSNVSPNYITKYCNDVIKQVVLGDSVTVIGEAAFAGCTGLTSFTIPEKVDSIGERAFYSCENLNRVYCHSNMDPAVAPDSFEDTDVKLVFVPKPSLELYRKSRWKDVGYVVPFGVMEEVTVEMTDAGYATFYYSDVDYIVPDGLSAMVVSGLANGNLAYRTIARGSESGVVPADVAVILVSDTKMAGTYKFLLADRVYEYDGQNMLMGSDIDTLTYANEGSRFYKLSYGAEGTDSGNEFGWYWGAHDGAAFNIDAHKAWLSIPLLTKGSIGYVLNSDATIIPQTSSTAEADKIFDVHGRTLSSPMRNGLSVINGKKIVVFE